MTHQMRLKCSLDGGACGFRGTIPALTQHLVEDHPPERVASVLVAWWISQDDVLKRKRSTQERL